MSFSKFLLLTAVTATGSCWAAEHHDGAHREHHAAAHHDAAHHAPIHAEKGLYTAVKGLVTLGESVRHNAETVIDGNSGRGFGLELGYKFGGGFAIESDASFARNDVTETTCVAPEGGTEECHSDSGSGEYTTLSLDIVYISHFTPSVGGFFKTGVEYEKERLSELHVNAHDTGVIYAAGAEYTISDHAALMLEYEGTTIKSPRGHSVFAGLLYAF